VVNAELITTDDPIVTIDPSYVIPADPPTFIVVAVKAPDIEAPVAFICPP
jgi:hypothetical protein